MKKQSLLRLMIPALIVSAALFVMASTRASHEATSCKEDCTAEKSCTSQPQPEFFLESLARNLLGH